MANWLTKEIKDKKSKKCIFSRDRQRLSLTNPLPSVPPGSFCSLSNSSRGLLCHCSFALPLPLPRSPSSQICLFLSGTSHLKSVPNVLIWKKSLFPLTWILTLRHVTTRMLDFFKWKKFLKYSMSVCVCVVGGISLGINPAFADVQVANTTSINGHAYYHIFCFFKATTLQLGWLGIRDY